MLGLSAATLAGYLAAIAVLMITPGPDMMFVLANATRYGTRAGAVAALGVAAGEAVHVAAALPGAPRVKATCEFGGADRLVFDHRTARQASLIRTILVSHVEVVHEVLRPWPASTLPE
ncbi:LysE family transporter [Micromonospora sp. WMMD714]|uniref:LysE family transporter n=1 Tax=Micromonospora sp. WMMD714 TaxID=3016097 RepID=UPI00249A5235|nr:LysE family transporter [Micromonospora sp. WMMD714]WFE66576.1 LysE family transporter [Micromonospora sp. WMMD714]